MRTNFVIALTSLLILASCKSHSSKKPTEPPVENKNYFNVGAFLQTEINYVDSFPLGILKYHTLQNQTDSGYIQTQEFDEIANEFLSTELKPEKFENDFTENSFVDNSTNAISFVYTPKEDTSSLKRVDVLATITEDGRNKVSSVYMEKVLHHNDTLLIKKMLWKTKTSLQIATSKEFQKQPPIIEQVKLVWNHE